MFRPLCLCLVGMLFSVAVRAQDTFVPRAQDAPPGPALTPQQAIAKMKVPDGFSVELVAAEPTIANPVAMTFDERGRIWVTESFEYPRKSAGPGKDRIKVLESTKGDGVYDKMTVFAEGLNIPSGIAVGHGGIWVANSPDLLFYKEGPDGKAIGEPEVVLTGFGRDDTHELPNSLTWGPDGWLYGWNGVFNPSHIRHRGKEFHFTCAIFRIHPKTREFQVWCEGTSNPWGLAFDTEGSAFASACVIDHLWHLVESGYYNRQGGPYPPNTWKLESIVKHRHQKAAYCGVTWYDSDAYPAEYRNKLYMGNIHGGCINADAIERSGASYFATTRNDLLTANDAWFMPVVQKTGPDGCLYVLDWYDRYHCYQDANRDPKGVDREKGRLYRIRYKGVANAGVFDLSKESDAALIARLGSGNGFFRDMAQRVLSERDTPATRSKLEAAIFDATLSRPNRLHALWARVSSGEVGDPLLLKLLAHDDPTFRAWGLRTAGNAGRVSPTVRQAVAASANDTSADVKLQAAIVAGKIADLDPLPIWVAVLSTCGTDRTIPPVVWQNLHPLLASRGNAFLAALEKADLSQPGFGGVIPRTIDLMLSQPKIDVGRVSSLLKLLAGQPKLGSRLLRSTITNVSNRIQTGEIAGEARVALAKAVLPVLAGIGTADLAFDIRVLSAGLGDANAVAALADSAKTASTPAPQRLRAIQTLIGLKTPGLTASAVEILSDPKKTPVAFRGELLDSLGKLEDPLAGTPLLGLFPKLEGELKPRLIEVLTQRADWAKPLLEAVAAKTIAPSAINLNQVRRMATMKDAEVAKAVKAIWGTVREERNPERETLVAEMKVMLRKTPGNATRGIAVFKTLCAQCHKMHGDGMEVGPDITNNGRSDFDQLVANVFDPSQVIGEGYVAWNVVTLKGQRLTGLLAENSPQRVALKIQGGKLETIARADVDEMGPSKVSLMPEGIEKQYKAQELADLFAYLMLDKPPTDPTARLIPGSPKFR